MTQLEMGILRKKLFIEELRAKGISVGQMMSHGVYKVDRKVQKDKQVEIREKKSSGSVSLKNELKEQGFYIEEDQ